jgi:hypothetical protein
MGIYEMKDLKNLARVVLIGVVIYITLPVIMSMLFMIQNLFTRSDESLYNILQYLLPDLARTFIVIIVTFLFIWKSDWLIQRIVKEDAELNLTVWSPAGVYRLAAVIMGGLFFYDSAKEIASEIGKMIDYSIPNKMGGIDWVMYFTESLSSIILLALGVYLLMGAPHFVKWQVKKTLEQLVETENIQRQSSNTE